LKKITGKIVKYLGFLLLGFFILWWITRSQDLDLIFLEVKKANYNWLLLAMAAGVLSHYIRALRWNILISSIGAKVHTSKAFHAVMTGYLANLMVPRLGEISKCVMLSKSTGVPFNNLAGTMVAERIVDLVTLVLLLFFTTVLQFQFIIGFINDFFLSDLLERYSDNMAIIIFGATSVVVLLIVISILVRRKLRKANPGSLKHKLKDQIKGFLEGLKSLWKVRQIGLFVFYSIVIWALYFLTAYLAFFSIEATSHLSPMAGITLLAVGSLGILAPVPAGIGTYHFMTITTLTMLYNITPEPATSYAYLSHAMQMVLIIGTNGVLWLIYSFKWKNLVRSKTG
jgi:uncharacterized protein (TIRG00374 family)